MSYASEKQKANPATLGAAILINGSIILAVALSPIVAERIRHTGTVIWDVPVDPTPPPDKPEQPTDTPKDNPTATQDSTTKVIDTTTNINTTTTGPTDTVISEGMGGGDDAVEIVKPVDPPKPIFKGAIRDPKYAGNFQPTYPPGLIQKEIEGSAKVKVLIGTDGRVRQVIILSATHPDFGKATERQALSKWRFKPATRDGVAVEDWQTLTVTFHLDT